MKNEKYHSVGTVQKSNRKIVERNTSTPNTQIHDRSLSWLGTGISIKCDNGVNLVLWTQTLTHKLKCLHITDYLT
jgi:hypothetical protein